MRLLALTFAATALAAIPAESASNRAECYEIAILECGLVWGGKDYGDSDYKQCINDRFDICDFLFDAGRGGDKRTAPQSNAPPSRLKSG
ncbi:MAG TPA: hypothetical protein VMF90_08760 [Rhizobiaceae bacterium]|nr:hypothetical protein [Rhizobiaceae bacterium]